MAPTKYPLLAEGLKFCEMIQNGNIAITKDVINSQLLESWEDIQILIRFGEVLRCEAMGDVRIYT